MTDNNIFSWATRELSQDAFLCYLLTYAKEEYREEYKEEHKFALQLLSHMLKKVEFDIEITNIMIEKQVTINVDKQVKIKKIDILLTLNDEYYLIIEDKTFTNEGYEQIKTYIENTVKQYKVDSTKVKGLYFKIGDESYQNIQSKENASMMRKEIIELFKLYTGTNIIILDYLKNLQKIENERIAFKDKNLISENYTKEEIIGFYNSLDEEFVKLKDKGNLPDEIKFDWGDVSNPSGGFMCYFFLDVLDFDKYKFYLQLQSKYEVITDKTIDNNPQKNLKMVVKVENNDRNIDILYKGFEVFKEKWNGKIDFSKPKRFARGTWMTQLEINNYIQFKHDGVIDSEKTALKIIDLLNELRELKPQLENLI